MNYRANLRALGFIVWIVGGSQLFPLMLAFTEHSTQYHTRTAFIISILISAALGGLLWLLGYAGRDDLHRKEGLFIVAVGWVLAGLVGALPFMISGAIPSLVDAMFESISGFTTTGASILTDIESLPRSILLWRSLTHWLGGMGIVVLFVAILPVLGIGGKHLYRIEATGPSVSGLLPRARDTARTLWLIYAGISVLEFLFLWLGGMDWFDAVCHTFGTMATGGFSTKNASMGYFGTYAQVVVTIFMFLCGVNFSLYYQAIRKRFLFFKDAEFKTYLGITLGLIALLGIMLAVSHAAGGFWLGLRDAGFTGVSILTTTGYGTADFEKWPHLSQGVLVLMMFVGGSAGSTGGGMKVIRVIIMVRYAWNHIHKMFRPNVVMPMRIGGEIIEPEVAEQTIGFVLLFLLWFVAGILVLLGCGHDLTTSLTASIATLGNIGPGLGMIGPTDNYAAIHPVGKTFCVVLMLVGRLEVFAISVLLSRSFWRR